MKVMINTTHNLNKKMLNDEFELVFDYMNCDFIISQSTVSQNQDFSKTIYIAAEAPLAPHRQMCYENFKNFHTVISHNPKGDNEFPYVQDGEDEFYPTRANGYPAFTREDTTIKDRGVFFAGMIGAWEDQPDNHEGINITKVRKQLGEYFRDNFKGSIIIGKGWGTQMDKENPWRLKKQERIKNSDCDFVLALENTMYPNYITEKIWDGIFTDRVTLYLGDPNIDKHIPLNCFIDLRPYFNKETKKIDCEAIGKILKEMTQEEYDKILNNARKFRKTAEGKFRKHMDYLTKFIIERIKNGRI